MNWIFSRFHPETGNIKYLNNPAGRTEALAKVGKSCLIKRLK